MILGNKLQRYQWEVQIRKLLRFPNIKTNVGMMRKKSLQQDRILMSKQNQRQHVEPKEFAEMSVKVF